MIQVNKPFLPPVSEYTDYVKGIWDRVFLTNNGPLVQELEQNIKNYLNVDYFSYLNNGTIAIQFALKALDVKGEVITTPFSYVATTSSLVWENCIPVFADIDTMTWNIDPNEIIKHITPKTSAILATHVFGNPCDIEAINKIAKEHNLKVIYDGAHCFGTTYKGRSVYNYGDASTASFHATKIFHTIEGGAVLSPHQEIIDKVNYFRNFGHDGPFKFATVGINGKNSEFHAAMGLVNLKYINQILEKYKANYFFYKEKLKNSGLVFQTIQPDSSPNFSYFPVLFPSETALNAAIELLNEKDIFPRRYFYPLLSDLSYTGGVSMPVADLVSNRILCLPFFYSITNKQIEEICDTLLSAQNVVS